MRKHVLLLVSLILAMMLLVSGVALAKNITGTNGNDNLRGTNKADKIFGGKGNDVLRGRAGADILEGQEDEDALYGGRGRDRIDTAGESADVVDCGAGTDWVKVDPTDQYVNCEQVEHYDPSSPQGLSQSEVAPVAD